MGGMIAPRNTACKTNGTPIAAVLAPPQVIRSALIGLARRQPACLYYRMLFRGMKPDSDGLPVAARNARALGVRVEGVFADVRPDPENRVLPGTGGLSVAPASMWNLPNHRRPLGMGRGSTGPRGDHVFGIENSAIQRVDLAVRPDPAVPDRHAFVEPAHVMTLSQYELNIECTRENWARVWP